MPGVGIPVSLAEILEVRNGPLTEFEVLAVLDRGLPTLQQLVEKGNFCALSANAVLLYHDGAVRFHTINHPSLENDDLMIFLPPEMQTGDLIDLEKLYVYSFGAVLNYALTFGGAGISPTAAAGTAISPDLMSLLNLLMVANPVNRLGIQKSIQMVSNQLRKKEIDSRETIVEMHHRIMGDEADVEIPNGIEAVKTAEVGTEVSPRKASFDDDLETNFKSPEIHSIAHQNGHNSTLDLYDDEDVEDNVEDEVKTNVKAEVEAEVKTNVETNVKAEVEAEVKTNVETNVKAEVKAEQKGIPNIENAKNEENLTPKAQEPPPTAATRRSLFYSEEESITMDEDKITVSRDELTSPEHDLDYFTYFQCLNRSLVKYLGDEMNNNKMIKKKESKNPFASDLDDDLTPRTEDEITPRKEEEGDTFDSRMQSNIGKNVHSLESPFDSPVMTSSRIVGQKPANDENGTWNKFDDTADWSAGSSSTLKNKEAKSPRPDDTMADAGNSWGTFEDDFVANSSEVAHEKEKETNSLKNVQSMQNESKKLNGRNPVTNGMKSKPIHAQDLGFCSPQVPLKKSKKRSSTISSTTSEPNMELKEDEDEHRIHSPVNRRESSGALKASAIFGSSLHDPLQQETPPRKESTEWSNNLQKSDELSDDYSLHSPDKSKRKGILQKPPSLTRQERISTSSSEDLPLKEVPVIVKVVEPAKRDHHSGSLDSTDGSTIDGGAELARKPYKRQAPQPSSVNTAAVNHAYEESPPRQTRTKEDSSSTTPEVPPRKKSQKKQQQQLEQEEKEDLQRFSSSLMPASASASSASSAVPPLVSAAPPPKSAAHPPSSTVPHSSSAAPPFVSVQSPQKFAQPPPISAANPPVVLVNGNAKNKKAEHRASSSIRSNRKTEMAGPEFLFRSREPSIRLKALSTGKRHALFHKIQERSVSVIMLNGQRVDVACDTLTTAGEVFEAVVNHTDLTEHHFFGLTYLKDGEHFFLEPTEKLKKFAPSGWNDDRHTFHAKVLFTLYLRIKFYPSSLDFIRNESTFHQLYLQLRRDVIDERLQCARDVAYQLAALALEAEFGDSPNSPNSQNSPNSAAAENSKGGEEYFQLDHYLPQRHLLDELGGNQRVRTMLRELHTQYSGMKRHEAEMEFVRSCLKLPEYGIHFHRLFKSKPTHSLAPTPLGDPDTGTSIWVGIMPRGVIMFEEKSGQRIPVSQHPWHLTQTLQFDRKKFAIVPKLDNNNNGNRPSKKLIYYTDSHKKSGYYVRFAALQHKHRMKMRTWEANAANQDGGTLERVRQGQRLVAPNSQSSHSAKSSMTDSGISREASPVERGEVSFAHSSRANRDREPTARTSAVDVSIPSKDRSFGMNLNETLSPGLAARLDELSPKNSVNLSPSSSSVPDAEYFTVQLLKDPQLGLGLTLVDGEIQGLKGVYVKSVTDGGPADAEGRLRVGDRVIGVNGVSMEGKTRHDAVNLVRQATSTITMEMMRLRCLYSSEEEASLSPSPHGKIAPIIGASAGAFAGGAMAERGVGAIAPPKAASTPKRSESTANDLTLDDSDLSGAEYDLGANHENAAPMAPAPVIHAQRSQMYGGLNMDSSESDEEGIDHKPVDRRNAYALDDAMSDDDDDLEFGAGYTPATLENRMKKDSMSRSDIIDWTDEIDIEEHGDVGETELIEVTLAKNSSGSLGIKVAGGKGQKRVYIKAIVDEPALSCPDIKLGDRIGSVNGQPTLDLSHQEVVSMLKHAQSPVRLGLSRVKIAETSNQSNGALSDLQGDFNDAYESEVQTIEVTLDKPLTGSLGLSLAKPTTPNAEGIYIRVISAGSVADVDGRLKVGDRLWEINGESVANCTPMEVVEKLKAAKGSVHIVVKR